jgi:hypothetical protein
MITMSLAKLSSMGQRTACVATHCNMVSAGPPPKDVLATLPLLSSFDRLGLAGGAEYALNDAGYSKIQGTKPQSIGTALNDSPAGLLSRGRWGRFHAPLYISLMIPTQKSTKTGEHENDFTARPVARPARMDRGEAPDLVGLATGGRVNPPAPSPHVYFISGYPDKNEQGGMKMTSPPMARSDCDGNVENAFSKMDMVTNVAMYWYGEAATSSARLYYEGPFGGHEGKIPAYAEINRAPVCG